MQTLSNNLLTFYISLYFARDYPTNQVNKRSLSERDICTKFITHALIKAGWDTQLQILEEVSFADGKIYGRGKMTARGIGESLNSKYGKA
ncbi:hypothetical protein EMGBS15_11370 [Filimonas sp.]|nr:hypothetical protein EMGBS15_11370 [Filimonas sp.]